MAVRELGPGDLAEALALLEAAGLPTDDLQLRADVRLWGIADGDGMTGVVGLERAGDSVLLRSLVVSPPERRRHIGLALVTHAEAEARRMGYRELFLLTTTASEFFRRLGYQTCERARVPGSLLQTAQFRSLCPVSASCLSKVL